MIRKGIPDNHQFDQVMTETTSESNNTFGSVESDSLVYLRSLFDGWGDAISVIAPIFQLEVIIDANVVLGDLIWQAKKRRDPESTLSIAGAHGVSDICPAGPRKIE